MPFSTLNQLPDLLGPPPSPWSTATGYGVAAGGVAAALLLRLGFTPVLGTELPFLFLWPAVLLAARVGGLVPGVFSVLTAAVVTAFWVMEPRFSLAISRPQDRVGLALFVAVGLGVTVAMHRMNRAEARARRRERAADAEYALLHALLGSLVDAVVTCGPDGRVLHLNPTAEILTGWPAKEADGAPAGTVLRLVRGPEREPVPDPVAEAL